MQSVILAWSCQIIGSGKNKKNINFSSTEISQIVTKDKPCNWKQNTKYDDGDDDDDDKVLYISL